MKKEKTPPAPLEENEAVAALSALAQAQRLRVFRALVVAGPQGLTPGTLTAELDIAPSALSFHLKALLHAGLVGSEPDGRHLVYRADFSRMNNLLDYLTEHCCQGVACEVAPAGKTTSSAKGGRKTMCC
ncbi:ArsR/SmtB family transcription factor [Hylemonella sp. W303a]|uniref:ArsR/SmtB family transcription factor n=1 Tax=Hylemonella sp. W303a TaxID=3389873 RepID=UPI00396B3F37